jgi:hypothetical protein
MMLGWVGSILKRNEEDYLKKKKIKKKKLRRLKNQLRVRMGKTDRPVITDGAV